MKTNSSSGQMSFNKESIFRQVLPLSFINKTAKRYGFTMRDDGKITLSIFLAGFMRSMAKGFCSYSAWANEIAILTGTSLTKQAVEERMNIKTENTLRALLDECFSKECNGLRVVSNEKFLNIYCEDSTHINLPENLSDHFPGNVSKGKQKALLKIHTLYNFSKNCFSQLNICSFKKNDQSLSGQSFENLKPGDLLLRDLGFFVLAQFRKMVSGGIFFITRKPYTVNVFDEINAEQIDVLKYLKGHHFMDKEVLVGKDQIRMRLIIIPVCKAKAAERRRKARNDRDKRLNHSRKYYRLLGYTLLLTNIETSKCSPEEVLNLYGLRWKIELIFKTWKTHLSMQRVIPNKCNNIYRINCFILLFLIYILIYQRLYRKFNAKEIIEISPFKLMTFVRQNIEIIFNSQFEQIRNIILTICRYENRKDRANIMEKFQLLSKYA